MSIISIEERPSPTGQVVVPMGALSHLDPGRRERLFLETMVAAGNESPVTRAVAIQAVVAERILNLGIPDGATVLYPVSGLINRNIEAGEHSAAVLADLYAEAENASDARAIIQAGLRLGDRALHYAAGFVGSRRAPNAATRRDYGFSMAYRGYGKAQRIAARALGVGDARGIDHMVTTLMARLGDTVRIIASLTDEETRKIVGASRKGLS